MSRGKCENRPPYIGVGEDLVSGSMIRGEVPGKLEKNLKHSLDIMSASDTLGNKDGWRRKTRLSQIS